MSRYNHHFANHFGSCILLAYAHDPHRGRDVQLRMLPGEFEAVGVTDGTDAWVAPVAGDPFSVGIKRILDGIREGRMPSPQPLGARKPRRALMTRPAPEKGPPRADYVSLSAPEQTAEQINALQQRARPRKQLMRHA